MKKILTYSLIAVVLAAIIFLVFTGNNGAGRRLDERMTFRFRDKIPYGTFVAYKNLRQIFPKADISSDTKEPGDWDSLSPHMSQQALLIVSPFFTAEQEEMEELIEFVKRGNDVFVSTMKVSFPVEKMLGCDVYYPVNFQGEWRIEKGDSLTVSIDVPVKQKPERFSYPGRSYDFWFYGYDTLRTTVLGYNESGRPNFIRLTAGKGHFFLQLAPTAFSNYFLLHKNNLAYYERAMSVISPDTRRVVWDEYFITKGQKKPEEQKTNWLSVFMRYPGLRWGLITALGTLLLYVLLEMRRKQRAVPVIHPPRNDSLDFVKTIGRLYHDKGDHANLCRKMAAYFLEHVRMRYQLTTTELDEALVINLRERTGVEEGILRGIISFIGDLNEGETVTDKELVFFHRNLETFYKTA